MPALLLRNLPSLYLIWALCFGLTVAWITPPWQNPDEPNHFLRATQISEGGLAGYRFADTAGGSVEAAIGQAAAPFEPLKFHPEVKVTAAMLAEGRAARWNGPRENVPFQTVVYPPVFYTPGVVAIWIGKLSRMRILDTQFLVRSFNVLVFSLLMAFALRTARRTRLALASIAVLPMTIALGVSVSQDSAMLAVMAVVVATIDRIIDEGRDMSSGEFAIVFAGTVFSGMARPPYMFLIGLLFLAVRRPSRTHWLLAALGTVCVLLWAGMTGPMVHAIFRDPALQVDYLRQNPLNVVHVAVNTLTNSFSTYVTQFVGILGWLDTGLPRGMTNAAVVVLLLSFASATNGPTRRPWLPPLLALGAWAFIFAIQYLTWTAPGSPVVDGVQGRYFLVTVMALSLAVPCLPPLGKWVDRLSLAGILGLMVAVPPVVIHALVRRYYLG